MQDYARAMQKPKAVQTAASGPRWLNIDDRIHISACKYD